MDARTLKALKGSIKKWEAIVEGAGADYGADNCPLCVAFLWEDSPDACAGCPIRGSNRENRYCRNTPYDAWITAHIEKERADYGSVIHDDDTAIAAVLELEFLRSLLPEK